MGTVIFDTHRFIKRLRESGFDEKQAEALSDAFKEAQSTSIEQLVTKSDLQLLESKLTGELTLLKWMMGFILAGILTLVLKAFFTF